MADVDGDGRDDVVVGAPTRAFGDVEDVGDVVDAGNVTVGYGGRLDGGGRRGPQPVVGRPAPEPDDRFGLAAG